MYSRSTIFCFSFCTLHTEGRDSIRHASANDVYVHHASDSRWFETCSARSQKHGTVTRRCTYVDIEVILSSQFGVPRVVASDYK